MQPASTVQQPAPLPASGKPVYLGMWTWLWQRASALVLMILLPWHWINPYSRPIRRAVLFFVIFHAMAGIRVMLTDVGVGESWQRRLTRLLMGIGQIIFLIYVTRYT